MVIKRKVKKTKKQTKRNYLPKSRDLKNKPGSKERKKKLEPKERKIGLLKKRKKNEKKTKKNYLPKSRDLNNKPGSKENENEKPYPKSRAEPDLRRE